MKLRLPHKFQAALMAALASVSFTTLSSGTLAVATGAALLAGQQAQAEDPLANVTYNGTFNNGQTTLTSTYASLKYGDAGTTLTSWMLEFTITQENTKNTQMLSMGRNPSWASGTERAGLGVFIWSGEGKFSFGINGGENHGDTLVMGSGSAEALAAANAPVTIRLAYDNGTAYLYSNGVMISRDVSTLSADQVNLVSSNGGQTYANSANFFTNAGNNKFSNVKVTDLTSISGQTEKVVNYIAYNSFEAPSNFSWAATGERANWTDQVWNKNDDPTLVNFDDGGSASFGAGKASTVDITTAVTAGAVSIGGQNYTFSLSGSGSSLTAAALTIESGRTLKVEGGTVSVSSLAGAGVLDIASGAVVANSSSTAFNGVKLSGDGTYALASGSTTLTAGLGDNWTGTVRISSVGSSTTRLDQTIAGLARTGSKVELRAVSGWIDSGMANVNLVLNGTAADETGAALTILNGSSGATRTLNGTISGKGDFVYSWGNSDGSSGNGQIHQFTGDVSGWTGNFKVTSGSKNSIEFLQSATDVRANIVQTGNSTFKASFINTASVTMSGAITKNTNGGTFALVVDAPTTFTNSVSVTSMSVNANKSATLQGAASITTVSGAGALTVNSGSNTVAVTNLNSTGGVTVQGGTLALSGNSSAGATVKSGAKLSFASTLTAGGTITVEEGGILYLGNAVYNTNAVTVGTLTMQDGAKLDLSGTGITGYETDAITLLKGGTITTTEPGGWQDVEVIFNGFGKTYTLDVVENNLVLTFAQEAKELEWTGADGATWEAGNNWTVKGSADPAAYEAGSKVYFTSTADSKTVTVGADVIAGAMTVSGSGYSVGGNGSVTVSGNFTVEAGGSMSLANGLTVSGDLAVADGGALELSNAAVSVVGGMQVAQGGKLTLSNAGLVKPVLTQATGAGEIVINAVTELNESFTSAFTGELTIAHSRTSGDFDLKLWGGTGKTYNFSSLKAFNLEEGAAVSYWGENSTINNLTLKGSAAFNIHATEPNNTPLTLSGTTDLNGYTLTMGNAETGWKRLVNIAALKGDASSKLVFEGGGYADGQKSRLTISSLQGFSGTLELKENNSNNPLEATLYGGTGNAAVSFKALNMVGAGEATFHVWENGAAHNFTVDTMTMAAGSKVTAYYATMANNTYAEHHLTIGNLTLDGNATVATSNFGGLLNIGKLTSTAARTLTLQSDANSDVKNIFNLGGEGVTETTFSGTLLVNQTQNGDRRTLNLILNDAYTAANAVVQFDAVTTANKRALAMGINADLVKIAGLKDGTMGTCADNSAYSLFSGSYDDVPYQFLSGTASSTFYDSINTKNRTLEITGGDSYSTSIRVLRNINLKMSGSGTQTFSGDVSQFDGSLETTSGTLAFTNAITAAALNGTGGTLQANGGLTVAGGTYAGTLTTSALTVNTGTLTFNGGTIDTATLSAGTGTLAITPGEGATVAFNKTLTNAGAITLGGEGELHIGNITGFTTFKEATEYTYSGAAGTKYEGSGFITGTNAQYYLIHGNGGSLSGNIGIHGGTRVTDGEGITDADYVFTVSGGEPLSTEYYVNNDLSYLDNDKDDGMDTAAGFIVKENVTFTTTGALLGQVAGRSVVLNQSSTLATTATTYFNVRQMASLTLNGDATVSTGGGRIALVADTSTYSDVALTLNGHTLTVTGDNGGFFGIVGNAALDAGTIALQGPKFMLGYDGKSGLTVTAPDTLVTLTNGSSLVPAHGNRFILEGLDMVGTGSAHISADGSTGNLTLKPDAGKHYTYKGDMTLVNLTLEGAADSSQTMDITADTTLTTLTVNSGKLVFQGGHTITVSQANNIVNTGTLEVAGTGTRLLLNNNGDANLGNVVLANGEIYNNADNKDNITRNITTLSVNGSSKLAQRTWNTIWNIGQLNNGDEAGDRTLTWVMSTGHSKPSVLKLNGEGNFSGTLVADRTSGNTNNGAYQAYVEINSQKALQNATLELKGGDANHYMALALNTAAVTLGGLNGTEHSVVYAGPAATASSGTMPTSTGSSVLTITGGGNFAGKVQSGVNLNITNGEATQTFSGDMSAFNGAIGVYNGKLAVTGNLAATELNAMYATLTVGGTLHLTNAENSTLDEVSLSLGGLTKDGAGTMSLNGIDHIGSTIQVTEGELTLSEGTYDISGIAPKSEPVIVVPTTTNGYASLEAEVQFITTSGTGTFTTPGSGLVITYTGGATANSIEADGSVVFRDSDYSTYYINDAAGAGSTLNLTDQQGKHSMLRNVVLNATSGTISVSDERSLDSLTQADGSTLNLAGSGELSVASVSNNAAIAFADGTSLTTTAALTVGSNKTFTTSGTGTFKGTALNVQGGTANLGSDVAITGNVLARSGSLNISGHTTVNGTLDGGDSSGSSAAITIAESGRLDVNTINVAWGFSSFTVNGALNVADNLQLATGNANYAIAGFGTVTTKKLTIGNTGKYTFDGTNGLKLVVGSGGIVKTGQWSPSLTLKNLTVEASENFTASMATMLNGTVKIDTNGHTVNYTAALSDPSQTGATAGTLVKQGSGVLTLSGAASFTGGLAVEAGELALNGGSGCNVAGPVALAAGTTLTVGTGAMVDAASITAATGGTISNAGTIKFGNKTIVLEEGATLTFTGNGGVYDISSMPLTGETTIYEGGSTPDNGFAKTSGQVLLVDTSNGGTFIYNATNTEFRHGQTVCDWDATTATVTVDDEGFDYSVFHVKKGEDLVSNAMAHEDTLESILMAQGTTLIIDRDIDVSLVQLEPEVDSYTLDVQKDNTLTIARNTATSVITGEGTVVLNDVPEGTVYTASFNAASPFTGTLVFDLADTVGNHNAYVTLDDTFQGTLELRGRMNGHNMNLGGATTLRLVGDRNSNFTGIWDNGTAMHITQALEVTGDSRVELWSENNQTTILDGTVNGGTDKVGHLSKVNNGNMDFNGAVALAEFITPGGTINFNAGANISTVNANGGNVNFKGDSTIDTLTANATATVDREATLALGTVNGTAANLVINGTVNVNGGTENALNNVTINQGGSLTFGAGTITTIAGTATISEAITNSGILNFNGPINIEGMDDSGLACYVGGQVDEVNGFKQYAANGTLTVVELQGEGASITVKEGTVVTYRGAAGTLGSDGVFTITETHVDYSMFYVNVEGASQEKYSLAGGGEHHPASVQLANGTSFEMDAAGATLDSLIVLEEDASATLKVTKNATVTEVNVAGDLTFEGSANLTLGANTNKAYINMAGNMVIDGTTVTVNGVNNNAFTGNIEVKSGTLKLGDDPAAAETYVLGEYTTRNGDRTITIDAQGTYDLNGKTDAKYFLTLNGGLLTNSGGAIGTGKAQTSGLKLLANSSIGGSDGDFHILSKGYAANNVDLQEHTLTKVGSNTVGFVNTTFDAGTLEVQGGALWFDADNCGDVTFNGPLSIVLNNAQAGNDPVLKGSGTAGDSSVNVNADVAIAATYSATTNLPLNMNGHTLSLSADGGQTQTVNGAITGTGNSNLVVGETAHNGTVVLAGANTYAGTTEVKAGTLAVSGSGSLGSGDVTVDKGATLQYDRTADQTTVANALSGEGTLKHTGSGTTEFTGNVAGFTGNIEVDAGTLNIMNIAEAANLNVADVTIGNGATMGVYNAADTTADTTHEGTLTIKDTNALTAGQGAKLNANLVMESGATLDVSGTGGAGLLMGSSVTLNPGVTLSADDMLAITGLDFMDQYTLFTGVDAFSYDGTTPTSTPITFDSETWVKASEVFSNDQFKTGEKDYYVFYSGVQNGSNVGAVYVLQIPEPTTGTLSLLALAALAARRRRK